MVHDCSSLVKKLNELMEKNEKFYERIERRMDQMTKDISELSTIVRNLNENQTTKEDVQLPVWDETYRSNIDLVKHTPSSTRIYGKEEHHRLMAFVAETMDLAYEEDDTEQNKNTKTESIKQIIKRLNDMARISVRLMYESIQADKKIDPCAMYWKQVPKSYKNKALKCMVDAAILSGIPLDRSEQDWAPFVILARRYRNIYHPVVRELRAEREREHMRITSARENALPTEDVAESSTMAKRRRRIDESLNEKTKKSKNNEDEDNEDEDNEDEDNVDEDNEDEDNVYEVNEDEDNVYEVNVYEDNVEDEFNLRNEDNLENEDVIGVEQYTLF